MCLFVVNKFVNKNQTLKHTITNLVLTISMLFFINKSLVIKMDININGLCWMLTLVLYLATTTSTKVTGGSSCTLPQYSKSGRLKNQ